MRRRILTSMWLLSLGAAVLTSGLVLVVTYNRLYTRMEREVANQAAYVATGLDSLGESYLHDISGVSSGNRLTLIAPDGTVKFDSEANPADMANHLDRTEVAEALRSGSGEAARLSATLGTQTFYHARRLENGDVIRVAGAVSSIYAAVWGALPVIVLIVLAIFALSAIVASHQTRRIVGPLNSLDLDNPLENEVYDELAPLLTRMDRQGRLIQAQLDDARKKQEEFTAITENMLEGLVVLDAKANVLSVNRSALRMLGVKGRCPNGKHILELNRSQALRAAVDAASKGSPSEIDLTLGGLQYQLMASPVRVEGAVTGVVLILVDVTQRRAAEQMRREFSANVSHELRTPLTSISGYAELIKNGLVGKEEDVILFAERIHAESSRLIELISDLMRLSRLDEGAGDPPKEDVELLALAHSVCQRLKPVASQRGVTVSVSGTDAVVRGSRQILEEIVENLCDNAIKYNRENGKVDVSVQRTARGVELAVKDTGSGIPEEHRERVFERFYRVDKSHSRESGGTGLGLSIVKHGAAYHNAKVELESEMDKGTTVRVVFFSN